MPKEAHKKGEKYPGLTYTAKTATDYKPPLLENGVCYFNITDHSVSEKESVLLGKEGLFSSFEPVIYPHTEQQTEKKQKEFFKS